MTTPHPLGATKWVNEARWWDTIARPVVLQYFTPNVGIIPKYRGSEENVAWN